MRIESPVTQKSSMAVKSVRKRHKDNKDEQQERSPSNSESLELSDTARLMNKLLYATSNKFTPYPFYFVNAAERNTKQASTIAKKIQNQAKTMGTTLNYTMIHDMVISLAERNHNILWVETATAKHKTLNTNERNLFEELHNTCLQYQIPTTAIASVAIKYIQLKQTRAIELPSKRECGKLIVESLKKDDTLNNTDAKKALGKIIKQYIIKNTEMEAL